MELTKFLRQPIMSYIRTGKPYPNFWGESHTRPNLIDLHGVSVSYAVYCYCNGIAYYLVDKDDIKHVKDVLFKKLYKNPKHVSHCLLKVNNAISEGELYFESIIPRLGKLTVSELKDVIKTYHRIKLDIQTYADSTYYFSEEILNKKFNSALDKHLGKGNSLKSMMVEILSTYDSMSFLEKEKVSLAKIALSGNPSKISSHISKWRHKTFDYWGPITPDDEFYDRFNEFRMNYGNTKKIIEYYEEYSNKIKFKKKIVTEKYKLPKNIVLLSRLISQIGFLNDTKKYGVTRLSYLFNYVLDEISLRTETEKEMLYYLLPSELEDFDNIIQHNSNMWLRKRMKWFVVIFQNGKINNFTTSKSEQISKDIKSIIDVKSQQHTKNLRNIKCSGITASNGKFEGVVVKMFSHKDIYKSKEKMVLVTPKTTVDFITAIHKAGAVITDYGGITSHSAVVSRERNIPCIVGTIKATKIFLDGDRVQVDGKTGVVKLIKR